MDCWSPEQYERFKDERSQPFRDLASLVEAWPDMRVLDLGCGTGELTAWLHEKLRPAETIGIDSSPSMLLKAGAHLRPRLRFARGEIGEYEPAAPGPDLIFSNAALQWVEDHPSLFARLTRWLAPGGQVAVQMPANFDHVAHRIAEEVAGESPFREALKGFVRRSPVLAPEDYATMLHQLGYERQHVRLQVYGHVLAGPEEVVEWVRGTLLTEYQKRLSGPVWEQFLERYRHVLLGRVDQRRPYFYPFKRLLLWAANPRSAGGS